MLRIYFLQQWFDLSDPQAEDAIYDSESMRRFARVELSEDVVPDETTILRFRHLLEEHGLTGKIFDAVRDLLTEKRLLLKAGTIVDATIIAARSSTKNATKTRDPEMKQTRKRKAWHFGMKLRTAWWRRTRRLRTSRVCRRCGDLMSKLEKFRRATTCAELPYDVGYSSYRGRSSAISYQGAFDPTKM